MRDFPEILSGVQAAVAKTLDLDGHEVTPDLRFFPDLNGESLEWLELSFYLEKTFGVRPPGIGSFAGIETDAEGRFTARGFAAMRAFMPAALLDRFKDCDSMPTSKELLEAITVLDIAHMMQMALEAKVDRLSA